MTALFSSYIKSIAAVGICAFVCEWICISGKGSENVKKTVSLIASLCVFITVIVPFSFGIKEMISNLDMSYTAEEPKNKNLENEFCSRIAEESEKMVKEKIFDKFGIIPYDVSIELCEQEKTLEFSFLSGIMNRRVLLCCDPYQ